MKVIVTGCTGLVGGALLRECVANDRISHVFALTRRPVTDEAVIGSPKVEVVIHDDFGTYPPELIAKLAGAEGCLWAIGGMVKKFSDYETARRVGVDYTLAATNAFMDAGFGKVEKLADGTEMKIFHMVYMSGKYTEWDQNKWLAFLGDSRRIKGQVEMGLKDVADSRDNPRLLVFAVRPGDVMPAGSFLGRRLAAKLAGGIEVGRLAKAMVTILLDGARGSIVEAEDLYKIAP